MRPFGRPVVSNADVRSIVDRIGVRAGAGIIDVRFDILADLKDGDSYGAMGKQTHP